MPISVQRWMWSRAQQALDEASRVRSDFCTLIGGPQTSSWSPPVDLYEVESGVALVLAIPGVAPGQLRVDLHGDEIRIRARRESPVALRGARVLHMEIPAGRFERSVRVTGGPFRLDEVTLLDGLLRLHLRRDPRIAP